MIKLPRGPMFGALRALCVALVYLVLVVTLGIVIVAALERRAHARDLGQWEATPPEVRSWFRSLKQPDNPAAPCCGEADAYWSDEFTTEGDDIIAIVTDDRDLPNRAPIEPGTRFRIPRDKVKFDAGNPTGHGILFVSPWGNVYCYVAPGGV